MDITVRIPDDLARRLGTAGELGRRALEALALEEFKLGHLTKPELRQLLGFGTRDALDGFLKAHHMFEPHSLDDLAAALPEALGEESRARARQAAANIIARRKGITLAGLDL